MKVTVCVGPDGQIIGTMRRAEGSHEAQARFAPSAGHSFHEIDLSDEDAKLKAPELHEKISKILGGVRKQPY